MISMGKTIKRLRLGKGATQEQLAEYLHISSQAVSKWENGMALPDILLLPSLSDYLGVPIDELFGHRMQIYTYKERFIQRMCDCGVMTFSPDGSRYWIHTDQLSTNAQISQIGECFADFIRENNIVFDAVLGIAYHGIAFSAATAFSLYHKYGVITSFGHDRRVPDRRGQIVCGYTPRNGDRIIVIDDLMGTGKTLERRLEQLRAVADVEIAAVIVIADRKITTRDGITGSERIAKKYHTQVHSVITDEDIRAAIQNGIVALSKNG